MTQTQTHPVRILAGLALLAGVAWLLTGQVLPALAFLLAVALLVVALLYDLASRQLLLDVAREINGSTAPALEVAYGAPVAQRLVLQPHSPLVRLVAALSILRVADQAVVPGLPSSGLAGAIAGGQIVEEREAPVVRRGVWQQGPTALVVSVPGDLLERQRVLAAATSVMVYPPVLPLGRCALLAGRGQGRIVAASVLDPTTRPQPPTVTGIRGYQRGDRWAKVAWKTRGGHGERYVLQFARVAEPSVLLVVDPTIPGALEWEDQLDRLDTLACAAACVAAYALRPPGGGSAVGVRWLVDPGAPNPLADPAIRQTHQLPRFLRELARLQPLHPTQLNTQPSSLPQRLDALLATPAGRQLQGLVVFTCRDPAAWHSTLAHAQAQGVPVRVATIAPSAKVATGAPAWTVSALSLAPNWAQPVHWRLLQAALEGTQGGGGVDGSSVA